MDLWIRSQDNGLYKMTDILPPLIADNDIVTIYGYSISGKHNFLGIYKSKQRASEVLDEIHKQMLPRLRVIFELFNPELDKETLKIKRKFGNDYVIKKNNEIIEPLYDYMVYVMPKD